MKIHIVGAGLETSACRLATALERRKRVLLIVFTLVYFTGAFFRSSGRPLWYDEVATIAIASVPAPSAIWTALSEGADANPPLSYVLVRAARATFGPGEVATRLPSTIGYWIFSLCLFHFTLRRTGIYYALAAMLIPFATTAYAYAVEARPYGQVLAFCGVALVCWQAAADGVRRPWTVLGLGGALAGALLSHYYAVLLYVPFAGAEMWRSFRFRKMDWAVWTAITVSVIPLVLCLPLMQGALKYNAHPWSRPQLAQLISFYEIIFAHTLLPLIFLLAVTAAYTMFQDSNAKRNAARLNIPDHEIVAGLLFLLLPAPALTMAFLATGMYTERYVITAVAGFAILFVIAACRIAGGRTVPGALVLFFSLLCFLGGVTHVSTFQNPFDNEPILKRALEKETVIVADAILFLQLWYYAPESTKPRLLYVASPELASSYTGVDSLDLNLLLLRRWGHIPVTTYDNFAAAATEVLVYQSAGNAGWLLSKLLQDGALVRLEVGTRERALLRVDLGR